MKYLLILAVLAGGYHFYSQGALSKSEETSPYKLFQKVANEPVSQEEVIKYATDRINETCPMLGDEFAIHDCKVTIANKIDFCVKMFKSDAPQFFNSKEEFKLHLSKLMKCAYDM
ncbi:hypothetical protein [Colwellia psychrerythraea]|uniref:Uncharacterized protein n=1 Tax=Colwellia psychrerythraea TaxID=28229 RepID=A0A099KIK5_COLPS|nr:hypothetical protein [Colwellia psychrerythraea]KGJ90619.1 hypothetical protein GAB14E_3619 [Colwellia psychrerythraea]